MAKRCREFLLVLNLIIKTAQYDDVSMKTITIPESEYLQMQQQLKRLQDQLKYYIDSRQVNQQPTTQYPASYQPVSIKRGSAKTIITYVAEDFTTPLQDFQDYLS